MEMEFVIATRLCISIVTTLEHNHLNLSFMLVGTDRFGILGLTSAIQATLTTAHGIRSPARLYK